MTNRELVFFSYIGKGNDPERDLKLIQEFNELGCTYDIRDTEVWVGLEVWLCSEKLKKALDDVESDNPKNRSYKFPLRTESGGNLCIKFVKGHPIVITLEGPKKNFKGWANLEMILESIRFGYFTMWTKNLEESEKLEGIKFLKKLIPGISEDNIKWIKNGGLY